MSAPESQYVTLLLKAAGRGDPGAADRLWSTVYDELHRMARHQLVNEGAGCTYQTTALIHEVYLRLTGDEPLDWSNRRHFFAAAARVMRQIRVDDARRRGRVKRGCGQRPVPLVDEPARAETDPAEVLAVDEALRKLDQTAPRQAEIVMLRYFGGLSIDDTAAALEVSPRTVDNEWRFARAWLHRELGDGHSDVQQRET